MENLLQGKEPQSKPSWRYFAWLVIMFFLGSCDNKSHIHVQKAIRKSLVLFSWKWSSHDEHYKPQYEIWKPSVNSIQSLWSVNFANAFYIFEILSDLDVHCASECEICPEVILNLGFYKMLGQHVSRKCEGKAVVFIRYCAVEKCHWRLSARKHVASRRVLQGCFFFTVQ